MVDGRSASGPLSVIEVAAGREWQVDVTGFWQVHPGAADVLADAVVEGLAPQPGERVFDLYCGVGLFAGVLADRGCEVWAVEQSRPAIRAAHLNLKDVADRVHLTVGRVERILTRLPDHCDLVVMDPPRSGVGHQVMAAVLARRPRAVAYVACDPAALARDLATAGGLGYETTPIRAFDLFPMTHHVECVAILAPADGSD
jgi:tRNA/tmRNA/rRNA uracil-C5-methylase (TrmA/RlmC/RlmD family)